MAPVEGRRGEGTKLAEGQRERGGTGFKALGFHGNVGRTLSIEGTHSDLYFNIPGGSLWSGMGLRVRNLL